MNGSWGSRVLWASLLAPPLLLLAAAAAVSVWPQRIIGMTDRAARFFSSEPTPTRQRQPMPLGPPPSPASAPEPSPLIRGVVRNPDGTSHDGLYSIGGVHYHGTNRFGPWGRYGSGSFTHELSRGKGTFAVQPQDELTWIIIEAPDHAPGLVGPIERENQKPDAPPVEVVLQEGFPHRVRVVDADGSPIARAEVAAALTLTPSPSRPSYPGQEKGRGTIAGPLRTTVWTDEEGWAVFPRVRPETDYEFAVTVYDCMLPDDTVFVRPEPGVDTVVTLPRSSTTGVVVDEEGRPSAEALVLIASEFDERNGQETSHPFESVIAAKTDALGKFRLPNLHRDSSYLIRVEGADDSLGFAGGVRASDPEIRVEVLPRRIVRGLISPEWASQVSISYMVPTGFAGRREATGAESVMQWGRRIRVASDGRLEFPVWDPSQVEFKIGGQFVPFPWPPPPGPIRFEPPEPPDEPTERTVRFRVRIEGSDRPNDPVDGKLTLHLTNGPPERSLEAVRRLVDVHNGQGTFTCLRKEAFRFDVDDLPGYWVFPGTFQAFPGDLPPVEAVHAIPARSIRGRVFESDGSPAGPGVNVSVRLRITPPSQPGTRDDPGVQTSEPFRSREMNDPNAESAFTPQQPTSPEPDAGVAVPLLSRFPPHASTTTDVDGRFMIKAWPVGVSGRIVVSRGRSEQIVAPIQVGPSDEAPEIRVELPRTTTAEIHLLDPDGRPLPDETLVVSLVHDDESRMWSAATTDSDGRARVEGLPESEPGDFKLAVKFTRDYQPIVLPFKPGSPLELKAERGRAIEGRIVEAVTGWPIPRMPLAIASTSNGLIVARTQSDDDGRFRIDTLPAGTYEVRLQLLFSGRRSWTSWPVVEAGSGRPVDLRVTNPSRSSPQPRRPGRP